MVVTNTIRLIITLGSENKQSAHLNCQKVTTIWLSLCYTVIHIQLVNCSIVAVSLRKTTYNKHHNNHMHAACYKDMGYNPPAAKVLFKFQCFIRAHDH